MPRVTAPARLSRPPYARMSYIHDQLQSDRNPNCSSLAAIFEVDRKTIQRDIDFMRDQLRLPIEYDGVKHGYHYTEPVENFPLATMTEGELVSLLIAQKAIEQYRGTSFETPLQNAFAKLTSQLHGPVTVALGDAKAVFGFKPLGVSKQDLKLFEKLSQAVMECREVEFTYKSLNGKGPEKRQVQPWQVCCVHNQWYLIGHDLVRKEKRTFALPRIAGAVLTQRRFVRPADFSLEKHLGSAFGIFTGTGDHHIKVRFDGWAARLVRERFWHDSQRLHERKDGGVEMELRLDCLEEVERWLLSFGAHVQVLQPKELRNRIATAARALLDAHQ